MAPKSQHRITNYRTTFYGELIRTVNERLEELGWTTEDLAHAIDYSDKSIKAILRSGRGGSWEFWDRTHNALNVDPILELRDRACPECGRRDGRLCERKGHQ